MSTVTDTTILTDQNLDLPTSQIIAEAAAKASALAALPIPLLDVGGSTYVQVNMIEKLAEKYGVPHNANQTLVISTLMGTILSKLLSEAIGSLTHETKLEKILSESLVKASISAFFTTVIGEVYEKHFQNGGSLDDIGLSNYKEYFREQLHSEQNNINNLASGLIDKLIAKFV